MSDNSNDTSTSSGTAGLSSSEQSSSRLASWPVQLVTRVGAMAMAAPVAIKLPQILSSESGDWTMKAVAILYVIVLVAPATLKDIASVFGSIRGSKGN